MKTVLEIEPAHESALRAAGLAGFDAMMGVRGGPATSRHGHRETVPIEIVSDGKVQKFFLKRVFRVPPKHAFWPLFRGELGRSQPYREWRTLVELEGAGISAMKRVAYGERRRFGMPRAAFLLVEAVPMAHTLENWLIPGFPKPGPIEKRLLDRLWYEVGVLVRRLCAAGFDWPDLNAKHIYARPGEDSDGKQRWEFCLIDVERMTRPEAWGKLDSPMGGIVDLAILKESLGRLLESLRPLQLGRSDWWRMVAGALSPAGVYRASRGRRPKEDRRAAISAMSSILLDVGGMPRLGDDYEHPHCAPLRREGDMFVDERVMPWLRAAGLGDFAALFGYQAGEEMAKPGLSSYRRRTRLELSNGQGEVRAFYLKRYQRPPLREQLRRMREHGFKSSCGRRELHFVKVLSRLGVPTLRGVGFGEKMFGPLERRSFGLTAEVGGESLETLAERAGVDPGEIPPWTQRREIIRQLALLVGHLHGNRLFHRDLYLCHVFLTRNVDGRIVLRLIDLARMLENPRRGGRWRIKDLAGLDYSAPAGLVTRADRLRFLYDYQAGGWPRVDGASGRDPEMKHRLRETIRRVRARGRRMARHDARRVRRLEGKGKA